MEIKSYDQIYENIKNYIIAHQNKITDFTKGSVISAFCEAVSRVIESLYLNTQLGFSSYTRGLPYSVFNFKALPGTKAGGRVVFKRVEPQDYITVIPAGTSISGGGFSFTTTERGIIMQGATVSSPIAASADEIGIKYNIDEETISIINGRVPPDIDGVSNPERFTGGTDKELWNDFVIRFNEYIIGLQNTNKNGLKTLIARSGLARSVGVVEHFPALNSVYNADIYCEDGSGGISPDALASIKRIIEGDGSSEYPARKAVGLNYRYLQPNVHILDFLIIIDINRIRAIDISVDILIFEIKKTVRNHIDGLHIGNNYYSANVISLIKGNKYINGLKIENPAQETITINDDAIFRCGTVIVSYVMS